MSMTIPPRKKKSAGDVGLELEFISIEVPGDATATTKNWKTVLVVRVWI